MMFHDRLSAIYKRCFVFLKRMWSFFMSGTYIHSIQSVVGKNPPAIKDLSHRRNPTPLILFIEDTDMVSHMNCFLFLANSLKFSALI